MKETQFLHPILQDLDAATSELELSKYLPHFRDLRKANPGISWLDFLLTSTIFYTALVSAVYVSARSGSHVILILIAPLAVYRGAVFIHEVQHSGPRIKGFSLAYNLLSAFPIRFPAMPKSPTASIIPPSLMERKTTQNMKQLPTIPWAR